jgi:hypothetical protein
VPRRAEAEIHARLGSVNRVVDSCASCPTKVEQKKVISLAVLLNRLSLRALDDAYGT